MVSFVKAPSAEELVESKEAGQTATQRGHTDFVSAGFLDLPSCCHGDLSVPEPLEFRASHLL